MSEPQTTTPTPPPVQQIVENELDFNEKMSAITQSLLAVLMVVGGFVLVAAQVAPEIGSGMIMAIAGYYFSRTSQRQNERAITAAVNTALVASAVMPHVVNHKV